MGKIFTAAALLFALYVAHLATQTVAAGMARYADTIAAERNH